MSSGNDAKSRGCLGWFVRLGLALTAAGIVVAAAVALLLYMQFQQFQQQPVLEPGETRKLVIPEGTAWPGIVDRVEEARLVEVGWHFDVWGRQTELAEKVRAGTFFLEGPMTLDELAEVLRRGGLADEVVVTFREGLTIFGMADRVEEAGLADRRSFLEVVGEPERYEWTDDGMETLEGYLYPDTYRFFVDAQVEAIVDELVDHWMERAEPLFDVHRQEFEELQRQYGFDRHDVVIMASLIELETSVDAERSVISRVFYNRLDRGMRLQTDPTCVYGESTYNEVPTPELCNDPLNRYSTYVIEGLPPGPIANPSLPSLEAALLPSEDPEVEDYLFFVSRRDGTGEHYFSATYEEHRRAVQRYLID